MRILINNEEVLCGKDFTIEEDLLNTSSVILNNVYPATWELDKDYVSRFYYPPDYAKCLIYNDENELIFCGVVKNTGKISLNPREPHFCDLQVLDFKMFLSNIILDFVIADKTIIEAINQVISAISDYGFVLGNVNLLNPDDVIKAYSTKDKSPYDVFQYITEVTQSRWTTRMIDDDTVAIDFFNPDLMADGVTIDYTKEWFEQYKINDMSFSYGTYDYRNQQVMTSEEVFANIENTETIIANGYQNQYQTEQKIGEINSITVDGVNASFATDDLKKLGVTAEFYYTAGNNYIDCDELLSVGSEIIINYTAIVQARQIVSNSDEIQRIAETTERNGILARYENRNDATTTRELQLIGESYIKYKGIPEIKLTIKSRANTWNVGEKVLFNAPLDELSKEYMVKTKKINYIATIDTIFYEYTLNSSFNSEDEINYFDNQRSKNLGNIKEGEAISRNVDFINTANVIFYDSKVTEIDINNNNILDSTLDGVFIS